MTCLLAAVVYALEILARPLGSTLSLDLVDWAAVALLAFTALQLVPIPASVVAILSPHAHGIRTLGGPHSFMPLSLDVPATMLGLMKLTPATLTFLAVRARVRRDGSRDVLMCVAVAGLLVALVSLLHRLTGWDRVYDLYEPLYVHADPLPAPFLNANHLAGALGLAAAVTIGLAFDETDRFKRLSMIAAAGFTGGTVMLTLSRGGIICFVAGQLVFVVLRLTQRLRSRQEGRSRRELAALPLALALGIASGSYVALRAIVREFVEGDTNKLRIWLDAMPMLRAYWPAGSGRGTFSLAYKGFQKLPDTVTYLYPENFLANWLGEWGIPVGGLFMLAVLAILVLGLLRPPRRARNAGALVAVFALMLQNFVDFSLELLGVLLPFVTVLAVETVRLEFGFGTRKQIVAVRLPRWAGLAGPAAALVIVASTTPYVVVHGLEADDARVREIDMSERNDGAFRSLLEESMARHPADHHLPLLGGIRAYHTGRSDPLPLLGRSLRLFPRSAVAHLYVARTLARAGRLDQSLVEYMETMRSRPGLSHIVADEVVGLSPDFERARVLARLPEDRVPAWEALAGAYLRAGYAEQARRADVATLGIDPLAPGPLARAVRRHMDAGLWDDARKLARRLATVPDYEARALALQGEIEHRTGNPTGALALYEMAFELNQSFRPVLLKVADLHFERGERKQMFDALELYQATSPTEEARGQALLVRASYEMKLGLTNQALFSYREASSSLPDDPGLWKAIARICEHLHEPAAALEAYRELARIEPENPDWQEKLEAAMAEATSKVLLEKE